MSIIYEYGKYIVSKEEYKKYKNKKDFFDHYITKDIIIKKIITYYNAYTILKNIYLIENTIFYDDKKENINLGSQYIYIKKIKCIEQLPHIKMKDNKLNIYFDLEYENINAYNIVNFLINFINVEKYTSRDKNKNENSYINYKTKIYSNKKNIVEELYLSENINYNKLINDFKLLNQNNPFFSNRIVRKYSRGIN